jgi:hypothetical protein
VRGGILFSAAIVSLLVLPCIQVPAGGDASKGRAANPPAAGDWDITGEVMVDSNLQFYGNVVVEPLAYLNITNGARLSVGGSPQRYTVTLMYGASLNILGGSTLACDAFEAMSGSGIHLAGGSTLSTRGDLRATFNHPAVLDSTILVSAPPGGDAVLRINCSTWGDFQRSNITVLAGDGVGGGPAMPGGRGGNATVVLENAPLYRCNLTARAGRGCDGGQGAGTFMSGGDGGGGGDLSATLNFSYISETSIDLEAGGGGGGPSGLSFSQHNGGDGGRGGDGGNAVLAWNGTNLLLSASSLVLQAGKAGFAGNGGDALSAACTGGRGGDGGRGGTAEPSVRAQGTVTILDSSISVLAGTGSAGGMYGAPGGAGTAGAAGRGGAGGGANFSMGLLDAFSASNSSISVAAGSGGAGGSGSVAENGGPGGGAGLQISVQTVNSPASFAMERRALAARGGAGGAGGVEISNGTGRAGGGGRGGDAGITIAAEGSFLANETSIDCAQGPGGTARPSAAPGEPGAASIRFLTEIAYLSNSSCSRTIGPVGEWALWTLDSTRIGAEPHFSFTGRGIAEEYWTKRVGVKDVDGHPIMDGSATVEVRHNGTLVDRRRTNTRGEAEFRLLDTVYTLAGPQYRSYTLSAHDTRGRFSQNMSVFWEPDFYVELVLLSKGSAPSCTFLSPEPQNQTIINASAFTGIGEDRKAYTISGEAADSPSNDDPDIRQVQLRFGDPAPWLDAALRLDGGRWLWNCSWDVQLWASQQLARYPLGIMPVAIYARSYNGYFWSDDSARGGEPVFVNVTVRLLSMPPAPLSIEITSPKEARPGWTTEVDVVAGRSVAFNARAAAGGSTHVVRWVWCFDDTAGFREDYVSNESPAANHSYPRGRQNEFVYAILKVYDNESQRRAALLRAGVGYGEFGYDFDPADGSVSVKIKINIRPEPAAEQTPVLWPWEVLGILVLAGAAISWFLRRRRKLPAGR